MSSSRLKRRGVLRIESVVVVVDPCCTARRESLLIGTFPSLLGIYMDMVHIVSYTNPT